MGEDLVHTKRMLPSLHCTEMIEECIHLGFLHHNQDIVHVNV